MKPEYLGLFFHVRGGPPTEYAVIQAKKEADFLSCLYIVLLLIGGGVYIYAVASLEHDTSFVRYAFIAVIGILGLCGGIEGMIQWHLLARDLRFVKDKEVCEIETLVKSEQDLTKYVKKIEGRPLVNVEVNMIREIMEKRKGKETSSK